MSAVPEPVGLESRSLWHIRRNPPQVPQTFPVSLRAMRHAFYGLQDSDRGCPATLDTPVAFARLAPLATYPAGRIAATLLHPRSADAHHSGTRRFTFGGSLVEAIPISSQ